MKQFSLKTILSLLKYRVSIAVTFTAVTGYIVYSGSFDLRILILALGVFVLAGGSSGLNQVQEHEYDAIMPRTKHRPIPTGAMSVLDAALISVFCIVVGSLLLYFAFGLVPSLLGLFTIFWYNLVYTKLKRISSFAVVPGSLVGAIPAFIGWTAAGGYLFDTTIVFIAFFMFIWQIPHFWLLMLKYGKEYEAAGFPTINQTIDPINLKKIIFVWIIATSFSSIVIPLFLVNLSWTFFILIFVLNVAFIGIFTQLSFGKTAEMNLMKSFISINIYMMLFMIMLILYHLIPSGNTI